MHTFTLYGAVCLLLASTVAHGTGADAVSPAAAKSTTAAPVEARKHSAGNTPRLTQGAVEAGCSPPRAPSAPLSDYEKRRRDAKIPFKDVCFEQAIVASSDATYFQALQQLFPDLKDDGNDTPSQIRDRRSEIKPDSLWPNENTQYELDRITHYLLIEEPEQTQLVLFFEDVGALALFRVLPKFELLDFIDVQQDQHSSLLILQPYDALQVKPGAWLFPVSNWHDNSSESFDNNLLFLTLDGQLRLAYDGPDFLSERDGKRPECKNTEGLTELKKLSTQHAQFADISLVLNRTRICEVEDDNGARTDKILYRKLYPATLYWDPKRRKYMGGSKDFVRAQNKG